MFNLYIFFFFFAEQNLTIIMDVPFNKSFNNNSSDIYQITYNSVSLQSHFQFSLFNFRANDEQTLNVFQQILGSCTTTLKGCTVSSLNFK